MNIDIEGALRYPMEDDDWLVTVLIGGALMLFSFLVIPAFAVAGYVVRAIDATSRGAEEPPAFEDWGELIVDGLLATVIVLLYQLIPLIVFAVTVGGSFLALLSGSDAGVGLGAAGFLGGIALTGVLSLVFGYVGLAGLINFSRTRSIGDGFDVDAITSLVTSGDYFVAVLAMLAINFVVNIVATIANAVTFGLASLLFVFVAFYVLVVSGSLYGQAYAAVMSSDSAVASS